MKLTTSTLTAVVHEPDASLVQSCSEQQLRELGAVITSTIEFGNQGMALIHELCGPEATGIAGELLKRFNFGLGFMREADAILAQLWRAKKKYEAHEGHQGQVGGGTAGSASTDAPALPLEEPGQAERGNSGMADRPSAGTGGGTEPVASQGCVVGNRTYMRHEWGMKGCKVCGMPFPVLEP